MNIINPNRSILLDFLKGIAIIAVILYHSGIFQYGYLGVEIFLVIGGYLITKSLAKSMNAGSFSYGSYLNKRLVRLWPLLIIISAVSLIAAYFVMLPDNMKNVSETALGSMTFTNNIVQYITSGNYWDQNNDFKPLMHTWYIAVMMQCYILYPLLLLLDKKFENRIGTGGFLLILTAISLGCYIAPGISTASKFYLLPARFFEFSLGGIIALRGRKQGHSYLIPLLILILVVLLGISAEFDPKETRLLVTVACVALLLNKYDNDYNISDQFEARLRGNAIIRLIAVMGLMSYSMYLWHQVVLAFYRYCINYDLNAAGYVICLSVSVVTGVVSFFFIEKKLTNWIVKNRGHLTCAYTISIACFMTLSIFSISIYKSKGFVRDVPEMGIYSPETADAPVTYNSVNGQIYDHDFKAGSNKKKVLVVGDSFGRDWINVLKESGYTDDSINLSYHTDIDNTLWERSRKADIIFLATNTGCEKYYDLMPLWLSKNFWRVGRKSFGRSMGPIYFYLRFKLQSSLPKINIPSEITDLEKEERKAFGNRYIDVEEKVKNKDGSAVILTPEGKFISQDGFHLTKAGAVFLAGKLNSEIKKALK